MSDRSGPDRVAIYRLVCDLGAAVESEGYDPNDFSTALMTYVARMTITGGGTDEQALENFRLILAAAGEPA